jgi:hypothetical protein
MDAVNFEKFYNEVSDMIKAIGTSSSANEERDERSVENYVRQSANTNTNNLQTGGSIVSNTTEPDPKGDIAITKSIPDGTTGPLIGQAIMTDASATPAPNGDSAVVPDQATIPSDATAAIAPTSEETAEATEETVEMVKSASCKECGQALPMKKSDDADEDDAKVEKAAACADCGEASCKCMDKAVDQETKETTPDDEKAEMKKSLWGGAFAPVKP